MTLKIIKVNFTQRKNIYYNIRIVVLAVTVFSGWLIFWNKQI